MTSNGDDSSVDDNLSSIGESTWDFVDEGSAASDDENRSLPRATFSSDGLEHLQAEGGSLEENDTSDGSGSQGVRSTQGHMTFAEIRHDTSSELEETNSSGAPSLAVKHDNDVETPSLRRLFTRKNPIQNLKFEEPATLLDEASTVDVSSQMTVFTGEQYRKLCKEYQIISEGIVGRVRQRMSNKDLQFRGPYKVLYIGPTHMKRPIMEKIGSALVSSSSKSLAESDIESSRVTIVPISSFGDESSSDRDVMLVDSLGLDMSIEECTSASYVKEETWKDTISLTLNGHKPVQSSWSPATKTFTVSKDYKLPDVAIIYLPESESVSSNQTRLLARSFMTRHEIPSIVIAAENNWKKPTKALFLDPRSPHFCVETSEAQKVLWRLPIDLPTFLEIDAGQMNRNLACLSSSGSVTADTDDKSEKIATQGLPRSIQAWRSRYPVASKAVSFSVLFLILLIGQYALYTGLLTTATFNKTPEPLTTAHSTVVPQTTLSFSTVSSAVPTSTSPQSPLPPLQTETKSVSTVHTNTDLASFLLESTLVPNKTDKFKVHVIGDCHVILRPPPWFLLMKKAPTLLFRVTRQEKVLNYEISTLFDGVYALKLPREDAHGIINISIWSVRKPKVNETFQVDFGTPWLKVAGWQMAAQALTEQVRDELHSAQTGLSWAYEHTSSSLQAFMRDAVRTADYVLKEVEKVGLKSIDQTTKTTEIMVAHSKELTRAVSHSLGSSASSRLAWAHRSSIRDDISSYSRRMSSLFTQQARVLSEAASGLNVIALAHEFQEYRATHLRETQKKALHMWWKVRGGPPPRTNVVQGERLPAHRYRPRSASNR